MSVNEKDIVKVDGEFGLAEVIKKHGLGLVVKYSRGHSEIVPADKVQPVDMGLWDPIALDELSL